jgi:hypothetical protein
MCLLGSGTWARRRATKSRAWRVSAFSPSWPVWGRYVAVCEPGSQRRRARSSSSRPAPLEQADDLVPEELLGGRGADVWHAHPLAGGGPSAARDERVYVGARVELVPERLGHRDHAGAEALLLAGRHGHQLAHGLPGRGAERAEELSVMHEVRAKHLGDGEDPLGVADVGDDLVLEEGGELGSALGPAGRAEPAPFAGKGEQVLGGAVGAADAGEALLEDAAVEVPRDHAVEEAAPEANWRRRAGRGPPVPP